MRTSRILAALVFFFASGSAAAAQTGVVTGLVRDQTGGALPGVTIELTAPRVTPRATATDATGRYRIEQVPPGTYTLSFRLLNFGDQQRRDLAIASGRTVTVDATMALALSADVLVVAKRTFAN